MRALFKISAIVMLGIVIFACNQADKKTLETGKQEIDSIPEAHVSKEPSMIFENEYAGVFLETLEAGQQQTEDDGVARVIYSLNDYLIEWNENGQNIGIKEWKMGDVHFHKPGNHFAKNLSNKPAEWLVFVRTSTELPACESMNSKKDTTVFNQEFASLINEDENFKVLKIVLAPGKMIPNHDGLNRLAYSLSDYKLSYTDEKGISNEKEFRKGDLHWHNGCAHSIKNTGATEADFILVAFKK